MQKDSKKRFQVNEQETNWGGFIIDADAVAALPFFDRAIKATAHADPDIVKEAWEERRTIVTSNAGDFYGTYKSFKGVRITRTAAIFGGCW